MGQQQVQQQALQVMVNALNLANKRGAFDLKEAEQVISAIKVFENPQSEAPAEGQVSESKAETA